MGHGDTGGPGAGVGVDGDDTQAGGAAGNVVQLVAAKTRVMEAVVHLPPDGSVDQPTEWAEFWSTAAQKMLGCPLT